MCCTFINFENFEDASDTVFAENATDTKELERTASAKICITKPYT
jgi:hypothetical protein